MITNAKIVLVPYGTAIGSVLANAYATDGSIIKIHVRFHHQDHVLVKAATVTAPLYL